LPLCSEGIEQSIKLKKFFSSVDIDKVYISPLKRCVETADIILDHKNIDRILVEDLTEINMGKWEGKTFKYIKEQYPEEFIIRGNNMDTYSPPEGESFEELQKRVMPAFENIIANNSKNILIIAHAGVNRAILSKLLNLPLKELFNINQPYGCVNELKWSRENSEWDYKIWF
jgi:probable phosphoglycerate mutase